MTPEFSRPEPVEAIGEQARNVTVTATEAERAALAKRFDLLTLDRLEGRFVVKRDLAGVAVAGTVEADLAQACSVTGVALPVQLTEAVDLRFVEPAPASDEVELADDAIDTIEIEDGAIDLGETAAETMALALDPFPRAPDAAEALRAAGVVSEDEVRPLNAFAGLKERLARR